MADEPAEETAPVADQREQELAQAFEQIRKNLRGLRFGSVTITVQDGLVVQIERTERTRLVRPRSR